MSSQTRMATIVLPRSKFLLAVMFASLLLVVPYFFHTQWFTGPLVNAILLLTCMYVGRMEAVIFGLFPSTVALASGLLPLPLAPIIPFIMIGNALFIACFAWLRQYQLSAAIITAAVLKFVFLTIAVQLVMADMIKEPLLSKLVTMMMWPQLFTALAGGAIAITIIKTRQFFFDK